MASNTNERDTAALNHLLEIAREVQLYIHLNDDVDIDSLMSRYIRNPKPACKEFILNLTTVSSHDLQNEKCPVCLAEYTAKDLNKQLPCRHHFHAECIIPWLEKTNTCPLCRKEYPTENIREEERRREREEGESRQQRLEDLHGSMFG